MQRIKLNDEVMVITGKDKGRHGKVIRVIKDQNNKPFRVVVEGINFVKKHIKPDPNKNIQGGIKDKEAPIHISNVAIFNPSTGKGEKTGIKTLEDGKKVRYFKVGNELVDI